MIKTITTERLTLRPIEQGDTGSIFQLFKDQNPGEVAGFVPFKNLESAGKYTADLVGMNKKGLSYHWAISLKDQPSLVGVCDVHLPAAHLIGMQCCEISFGLARQLRGLGYMREALTACLEFLFSQEGLYRVEAHVSTTNLPSRRLLEGLGFVQEGVLRKKWLTGRMRHDMVAYALLANEMVK